MSRQLSALVLVVDIVIAAVLASSVWPLTAARFKDMALPEPFAGLVLFVSAWVAILWANGAYRLRDRGSFQVDAQVVTRSFVWLAFGTLIFLYLAKLPDVSRLYLLLLFVSLAIATLAARLVLRGLLASGRGVRRVA